MMNKIMLDIINFIKSKNKITNKEVLSSEVQKRYGLEKDSGVFYLPGQFAIRFSESERRNPSNTVIALSKLRKHDEKPFLVCLVTPDENILFLANTTFIKRVSHSSKGLTKNNIKGSINFPDIQKTFLGLENCPENFDKLFSYHTNFEDNLSRIVEATSNITPIVKKFSVAKDSQTNENIVNAPYRACDFVKSAEYKELKDKLDRKVEKHKNEIILASKTSSEKVRGDNIEKLITGSRMDNSLGDYYHSFEEFYVGVDIKSKLMYRGSAPKGYNIDKFLQFLSKEKSVFMLYFIGFEENRIEGTALISVFQNDLIDSTGYQDHWSGRGTRGTAQFKGDIIKHLILSPNNHIDIGKSRKKLEELIDL